jgi:hypothetical protein
MIGLATRSGWLQGANQITHGNRHRLSFNWVSGRANRGLQLPGGSAGVIFCARLVDIPNVGTEAAQLHHEAARGFYGAAA